MMNPALMLIALLPWGSTAQADASRQPIVCIADTRQLLNPSVIDKAFPASRFKKIKLDFSQVCSGKEACDVVILSGQLDDALLARSKLGDKSPQESHSDGLSIKSFYQRSCTKLCDNVFHSPREVFIFAENQEEPSLLPSLSRDIRNIFAGVPHIHLKFKDFDGTLKREIGRKSDYLRFLTEEALKIGSNTAIVMTRNQSFQAGECRGSSVNDGAYQEICRLYDSNIDAGPEGILVPLGQMLASKEPVPRFADVYRYRALLSHMRERAEEEKDRKWIAYFERIKDLKSAKSKYFALIKNLRSLDTKFDLIELALTLGWLAPKEAAREKASIVSSYINAEPLSEARTEFLCGLSNRFDFEMTAKDLNDRLYENRAGLGLIRCLKPKDLSIQLQLLKKFKAGRSAGLREDLVYTIGDLPPSGEGVQFELLKTLTHPEIRLRNASYQALASSKEFSERLQLALMQLLTEHDDLETRRRAVHLLELAQPTNEGIVSTLIQNGIRDPDTPIKRSSMSALKSSMAKNPKTVETIFSLLVDKSLLVRKQALELIASNCLAISDANLITKLEPLLSEASDAVREGALRTMNACGSAAPKIFAQAAAMLSDTSPAVKRAAAEFLTYQRSTDPAIHLAIVKAALSSNDKGLRKYLLSVLARRIRPKDAAPQMELAKELLKETDYDRIHEIKDVLEASGIRHAEVLKLLLPGLQDEGRNSIPYLFKHLNDIPDKAEVVRRLVDLFDHPDDRVKSVALQALRRVDLDPQQLVKLAQMLKTSDRELRRDILRKLSESQTKDETVHVEITRHLSLDSNDLLDAAEALGRLQPTSMVVLQRYAPFIDRLNSPDRPIARSEPKH